jgi:small-conductance mechanosensitive channel
MAWFSFAIDFLFYVILGLFIRRVVWLLKPIRHDSILKNSGYLVDRGILLFSLLAMLDSFPIQLRVGLWSIFQLKAASVAVSLFVFFPLVEAISQSSLFPQTLLPATRERIAELAKAAIVIVAAVSLSEFLFVSSNIVINGFWIILFLSLAISIRNAAHDFSSGVFLTLSQNFQEGVPIKLEGIEGTIQHIGWRSLSVRTSSGTAIIPLSKVATAIITKS